MKKFLKIMLIKIVCQFVACGLCKKYGVDNVPVYISTLKEGTYGAYASSKKVIRLDYWQITKDKQSVYKTLLHEFRHHWQASCYKELNLWWMKHREFYEDIYYYSLIELDARRFAKSDGQIDSPEILTNFPVEKLDRYLLDGTLERRCKDYFALLVERGEL